MARQFPGMMKALQDFKSGFTDRFGESPEDFRRSFFDARIEQDLDDTGVPSLSMMSGIHPVATRVRDRIGASDTVHRNTRSRHGLGFDQGANKSRKIGDWAGAVANDGIFNSSRNFWWLLNAAQAGVDVGNELLLQKAAQGLFKATPRSRTSPLDGTSRPEVFYASDFDPINQSRSKEVQSLIDDGWIDSDSLTPKKGVRIRTVKSIKPDQTTLRPGAEGEIQRRVIENVLDLEQPLEGNFDARSINSDDLQRINNGIRATRFVTKRNFEPGHVQALNLPSQIAINSTLGLMNPFGGQEGYTALYPTQEDASVSDNPLLEIGTKYIMGRTGNMLPWQEFKQVRPDVSKDEYMRYKAFKYDKDIDLNPFDDGKLGLPSGALKYTQEGIHGPEAQFLGRSIPVTTGIIPTATAMAATALGARYGKRPILTGALSGMGGLAAGSGVGSLLENERRRRNLEENQSNISL